MFHVPNQAAIMKISVLLVLLFTATCAFSQNGKITINTQAADPDGQTTFLYEPPAGLNLPEDIQVNVSCSNIQQKSYPLEKKGPAYEFAMKLPSTSTVLFFAVSDSKQNVVDNNSGKGFVVYLKDPDSDGFGETLLEEIKNVGMAAYFLKLDIQTEDVLKAYESLFASYPDMKTESEYATYLMVKFQTDKEGTRPELMAYAEQMAGKDDEESLTAAYNIYMNLGMTDEMNELQKVALEKYPKGEIAKNTFIMDIYSVRDPDATYLSGKIDEYIRKFGDPKDPNLEMIYYRLIVLYLDEKDTLSVAKYQDQITNKNLWVNIYNSYAWKATGGDLTSPGQDLDLAEKMSRKSLDILEYLMEHPEETEGRSDPEEMYHMCADTYALILYKQKKYEQAFKYQHAIVEAIGDRMSTGGKERYAAFAEKARGTEFAKDYLEKQLLTGIDSRIMVEQLQEIYTKLNLPDDEFEHLKKQYAESAAQKDKDEIIEMFGDTRAMDFTLTNLEGENVALSDNQGKVVVLDFWATWCGPCISSFPHMQELVNQFQDKEVEFFFIDSWERQEPDKTREKVVQFLEENKYNFNVLFDYNDEVISTYKVLGIPSRFLIDKSGNIRAIIHYSDDLAAMINQSLLLE